MDQLNGKEGSQFDESKVDDYRTTKNVEIFFTAEEWGATGTYERGIFQSQLEFYQLKLKIGLRASKTTFMVEYERRVEQEKKEQIKKQANENRALAKKKLEEQGKEKNKKTKRAPNGGEIERPNANEEYREPTGPYQMRRVKKVFYHMFFDDPDNDLLIACDLCVADFKDGYCNVHGSVTWMSDTQVVKGEPNRAEKTLPRFLKLTASVVPGAGKGVLAMEPIPARVIFGPYEGEVKSVAEGDYCWMVKEIGKQAEYIDGANVEQSNWLRYVNCARHKQEQNLVAFQYKGQLYYRTMRPIERFTELLVWYGDSYASELGVSLPARVPSEFAPDLPEGDKFESTLVFKCIDCNEEFTVSEVYMRHRRRLHKVSVECSIPVPPEVLTNEDHSNDSGVSSFSETAGKKTSRASRVVKIVDELKLHTDNLEESSSSNKGFVEEARRDSDKNGNSFSCETCGKHFKRRSDFECHIQNVHTLQKLYSCDYCGKTFSRSNDKRRHVKLVHLKERNYRCEQCGKNFGQKSDKEKHIRKVHLLKKTYICILCDKVCQSKKERSHHVQTDHLQKEGYKCDVCDDSFSEKTNLVRHVRAVHLQKRDFQCDICEASFGHKRNRDRHVRSVHLKKRGYVCDDCGKGFPAKWSRDYHVRTAHLKTQN